MVRFTVGSCLLKAVCHGVPVSVPWLNGYSCGLLFSWVLVDFLLLCKGSVIAVKGNWFVECILFGIGSRESLVFQ